MGQVLLRAAELSGAGGRRGVDGLENIEASIHKQSEKTRPSGRVPLEIRTTLFFSIFSFYFFN